MPSPGATCPPTACPARPACGTIDGMTYRSHPRHRRDPDAGPGSTAGDPQATGTVCTCTGGPYVHGPEGLRRALKEIGTASVSPTKEPLTEGEPEE